MNPPRTSSGLSPIERRVLSEIAHPGAGEDVAAFGAATAQALEALQARGYITRDRAPKLTDKGRAELGLRHPKRAPLNALPRPQQAGIMCNDPEFQRFVGSRTLHSGLAVNASACAEFIRLHCGVNSRADLATNPAAATRFDALRTDFDAWRGRLPQQR